MNDGKTEVKYLKWPVEIQLDDYNQALLQLNLKDVDKVVIPFRIIEWTSASCETTDHWNAKECTINIIYEGEIWFDGIRHSNFSPNEDGYINYLNPKILSKGLGILDEYCVKYCYDWLYP